MFLRVLQCVYRSLGEGKAKFIERLICEAIFNLEGISTKEGQVTLVQKFTIYKGVSQQYSNNIMTDLTWRLLVRNLCPEDPIDSFLSWLCTQYRIFITLLQTTQIVFFIAKLFLLFITLLVKYKLLNMIRPPPLLPNGPNPIMPRPWENLHCPINGERAVYGCREVFTLSHL